MKKVIKIICLFVFSITDTFAGSATATQTVALYVEEVALISVGHDLTITLDTITNAGDNFTEKSETSTYAITSTVVSGQTRQLEVRLSQALTDLQLRIQMGGQEVILTTIAQTILSGIGNMATAGQIIYTLIPTAAMVDYGERTVTVNYTLTDDG